MDVVPPAAIDAASIHSGAWAASTASSAAAEEKEEKEEGLAAAAAAAMAVVVGWAAGSTRLSALGLGGAWFFWPWLLSLKRLAFQSSKDKKMSSSTGSNGARGLRQQTSSSGSLGVNRMEHVIRRRWWRIIDES